MTSHKQRQSSHRRNHYLDLLRLTLALLVMLSHAPELKDGDAHREIFHRITRSGFTFGTLAVTCFFLLSGSLIVQSWIQNPSLKDYLRKRLLRIVPGYIVAVTLSIVLAGLLAPSGSTRFFFTHLHHGLLLSILKLSSPETPPVFPNTNYPLVNGAVYTIHYEFLCYLAVAAFGLLGLLGRKTWWTVATALLFVLYILSLTTPALFGSLARHQAIFQSYLPLSLAFFMGGVIFLYRDLLPFRRWLVAVMLLLATLLILGFPLFVGVAVVLCGGYVLQYISGARWPAPAWLVRLPDISYGTYLYGWPVEKFWLWYRPQDTPWIVFAGSACVALLLGWVSWHVIERPMLKLRRGGTAPLAPA